MKIKIAEVIVVEGRDDVVNLNRFVEGDYIVTKGFHLTQQTLLAIETAAKTRGVIIMTDPDFAGNVIRSRIVKTLSKAEGCVVKHAYITREEGTKSGDIGVENADGEAIVRALQNAHAQTQQNERVALYKERDLYDLGLVGTSDSKMLREDLGQFLKIGYANGKQLLNRLNAYQVPPEKIAAFFEAQSAEEEVKQ